MVKILENILEPIRLPGSDELEVGHIVSISYADSDFRCILSNDQNPFGIMVGSADKWGNILVLNSMAILRVDKFEIQDKYSVGDFLYCNNSGFLTNKKFKDNSLMLGHVLEGPDEADSSMEISWI